MTTRDYVPRPMLKGQSPLVQSAPAARSEVITNVGPRLKPNNGVHTGGKGTPIFLGSHSSWSGSLTILPAPLWNSLPRQGNAGSIRASTHVSVSYTHLTLPTICSV